MEKQELSKAQCFLITILITGAWLENPFLPVIVIVNVAQYFVAEKKSIVWKRTYRLLSKTRQNNQKLKLREGNQNLGHLEKVQISKIRRKIKTQEKVQDDT